MSAKHRPAVTKLLIRLVLAAYWLFLSALLLVPDPRAMVGFDRLGVSVPNRGVHFAFFTGLAILAWMSRLPLRGWVLGALLVGYAVAAESAQYFVPPRTVEGLDYLENLLGLATGTCVWWLLRRGNGRGGEG